jgi:hypothetical protein
MVAIISRVIYTQLILKLYIKMEEISHEKST